MSSFSSARAACRSMCLCVFSWHAGCGYSLERQGMGEFMFEVFLKRTCARCVRNFNRGYKPGPNSTLAHVTSILSKRRCPRKAQSHRNRIPCRSRPAITAGGFPVPAAACRTLAEATLAGHSPLCAQGHQTRQNHCRSDSTCRWLGKC